jgi:hypothetical protein
MTKRCWQCLAPIFPERLSCQDCGTLYVDADRELVPTDRREFRISLTIALFAIVLWAIGRIMWLNWT